MLVTVDTSLIPSPTFSLIVRKNNTNKAVRRCPVGDPAWLKSLLKSGCNLQLADVLVQAGRHFSDRINPDAFPEGPTRRQLATAMAWTIISLVSPTVTTGQLVVDDPLDGDIKRLCSEILGVGMSLEVLRKAGVIDGRTIRKISGGFDFDAIENGGGGRVLIEAKGTFRNASTSEHRTSIYNKIVTEGLPRGYRRAIGVIASLWTAADMRDFDLEICDPEKPAENHFEEAVREIIRFYARRFEEAVAVQAGVELLFSAANSPDLFDKTKAPPLPDATLQPQRLIDPLRHNSLRLNRAGVVQEFWGRIWEARKLPIPLPFETSTEANRLQAFMGIDSAIFRYVRDRDFKGLLDYKSPDDGLWEAAGEAFRGVFQVDSYGIVIGLYEGSLPINVSTGKNLDPNDSDGMTPFDAISIRKSFHLTAIEAERYLEEIYPKTATQPSYKHFVDEMTAKFYAYDALAARAWKSPEDLVAAAEMLLDVEIRDSREFDHDRVERYRRNFLNEVVSRYKT